MRKILVIITGGVAIYKICTFIRLLKKAEVEVRCLMTESATHLISPNLFATLSDNAVATDMFINTQSNIVHISLAKWAEIVAIAPATANIIGKVANGIADDLASTTIMALGRKPVIVAPAMNVEMWNSKPFQRNLKQIIKDGMIVLEPTSGSLACGDDAKGRMVEPEILFNKIKEYL
jgi:phosphopantothenoylcysteine decarboxylase/phosphopantothenate--cysteine ligase